MTPDDVRASRVEWITAYLKADPSLLREVLEGLGLPNYAAASLVADSKMEQIIGAPDYVPLFVLRQAVDAAWRLPPEEET